MERRFFANYQSDPEGYGPDWGLADLWLEVDVSSHPWILPGRGVVLREVHYYPSVDRSVVIAADSDFDPLTRDIRGDRGVFLAGWTEEGGFTELSEAAFERLWEYHSARHDPP